MRSYAVVDRIEGDYAVCELELISTTESNHEDFRSKETEMVDVPVSTITDVTGEVNESDVLVVEQDRGTITRICYMDNEEKERRIELIRLILNN